MVYAVPEQARDRVAPDDHLRRVMNEFVVSVVSSSNLIVVQTPVGSAHVVASALDRNGFPGVLGTVAGDDTILLVVADDHHAPTVADALREVAGLNEGTAS